ncbi:methyltransferase [Saccharothrix lopnurensis]|uniref:Methyltransferase n=1 Tax=Saccharothrix lopnurensis TaxID=1670621 RepID=A0ABW1P354_9PSEU
MALTETGDHEPLDEPEYRRLAEAVSSTRSTSTEQALAAALGGPGGPAAHLEFTHTAVLVAARSVDDVVAALVELGVRPEEQVPGEPVPDEPTRDRLARLTGHDLGADVRLVRCALPGCPRGLEVSVLGGPAGPDRVGWAHPVFRVAGDEVVSRGVYEALRDAGLVPDGGGHDPRGNATALHLRGRTGVELRLPGHRTDLLRRHLGRPDEARRAMFELVTGAWRTRAVAAVAELGVADLLAGGPRTTADLSERTGTRPGELHRVLAFLGALGVLHRDGDAWSLTEAGALLRADADGSLRDLARLYGGLFYLSFTALEQTLRVGGSAFEHFYGVLPFEHFAEHPADARLFEGAMAAGTSFLNLVPGLLDLPETGTVVDVAGGDGRLLGLVLAAAPGLRGVLFDRPHVAGAAREVLARSGCADRAEVVAGDFFTDPVPAGGDVYLLSRVLHDWDDERCSTILRNVRSAMPDGALLAVVERPIRDDRSVLPLSFNVHMMVNTALGGERTADRHRELLAEHGFTLEDIRELPLDMAVLVARATPV